MTTANRPMPTTRQILQRLERLERAGVRYLARGSRRIEASPSTPPAATGLGATNTAPPFSPPAPLTETAPPMPPRPPAEAVVQSPRAARAPAQSLTARREALAVIQKEVAGCRRCAKLASTRKQTVFGVGNPQARLVFCGEAPGADEDAQGEPFVGRAGQLLTKIIEACTLRREDVYILNVLKCRPPENRNPLPDEVANCRGYLDRQLEIIRPEFICCLGSVAAKTLLETEASIGKLRGRFHDYRGIPVWCTYHPAYLLRNPAAKKDVWEDMKKLMAKLGVDL